MNHPRTRGFSRMDALGLVLLLIAVIAILLPALNAGLMRNRALYSIKHMRGIHSGMVLFGSGSKDFFPGLDSNGRPMSDAIPAGPGEYGTISTDGTSVVYRLTLLLRGNFLAPDYLISPSEIDPRIVPAEYGKDLLPGRHYSFALLNISQQGAHRQGEWRSRNSAQAAILSDRNIGGPGSSGGILSQAAQSLHNNPGEGWRGAVVYNDNHGVFETSDMITTQYVEKGKVDNDGLFSDADITKQGVAGADAAMVFQDNVSYHGQTAR